MRGDSARTFSCLSGIRAEPPELPSAVCRPPFTRSSVRRSVALLLLVSAPLTAQGKAIDPRVTRADLARIEGKPTAKHWILIVSDFQCPYCKEFHEKTAAQVRKEFVQTGIARMAYIHFPLRIHPNAVPAAEASMCAAAQGKFWPFHDRLFATQQRWAAEAAPDATYRTFARELGLALPEFEQCMRDDVMLPMIQADYQRGVQVGVNSTPTILVDNIRLDGNAPIASIRRAMQQVRAAAR